MKKFIWISLSLLIVIPACNKSNDNNSGWTAADQASYDKILSLQDSAVHIMKCAR